MRLLSQMAEIMVLSWDILINKLFIALYYKLLSTDVELKPVLLFLRDKMLLFLCPRFTD